MGQIFVQELAKEALDEIWAVGRNEQRLLSLKNEFGDKDYRYGSLPGMGDTDMLSKEINGEKVRFPGIIAPGRNSIYQIRQNHTSGMFISFLNLTASSHKGNSR